MRLSCNGCRVLRKGCSDTCSIRPCLDWIKSPDAQANSTLFLAKFYGRAGLLNLLNAGPPDLRPAIFKSLLYEACGRIVNPIYGSVGLLWTGSWSLCQAAVEAVLKGAPIEPIPTEESAAKGSKNSPSSLLLPFKACDIRHVPKHGEDKPAEEPQDLHKLLKPVRRTRFKRTKKPNPAELLVSKSGSSKDGSGLSHHSGGGESDAVSAETVEAEAGGALLDLTLGFGSGSCPAQKAKLNSTGPDEPESMPELALALTLAC